MNPEREFTAETQRRQRRKVEPACVISKVLTGVGGI
jgi:hypothetical protein